MLPRALTASAALGLAALVLAACKEVGPAPTPPAPGAGPSPAVTLAATLGPTPPAAPTVRPTATATPATVPAPSPAKGVRPPPAATATPFVGLLLPPAFIPPPDAVKLELVIHPVDFKGRRVLGPAGESYLFVPIVVVEPRALNQGLTMISNPMSSEPNGGIFYFKRDTVVTLSAQDNRCWFFANWDTTAPVVAIPRRPTIYDLYLTQIQVRLDRDIKITAYFGKTADYYRSDLTPPCVRE